MSIVDHLETLIGPIAGGWSDPTEPGSPQIVRFDDAPIEHVCTYTTLGLSRHVLRMPGGRDVRQELLMAASCAYKREEVLRCVHAAAQGLLVDHHALLRGELLVGHTPIVEGSTCTCAYVAPPSLFDDALHVYDGSSPPTVIAWLVPITSAEATFVRKDGGDAFESLLEDRQPDLFDWSRPSIV